MIKIKATPDEVNYGAQNWLLRWKVKLLVLWKNMFHWKSHFPIGTTPTNRDLQRQKTQNKSTSFQNFLPFVRYLSCLLGCCIIRIFRRHAIQSKPYTSRGKYKIKAFVTLHKADTQIISFWATRVVGTSNVWECKEWKKSMLFSSLLSTVEA